jgi:hypothetical protein
VKNIQRPSCLTISKAQLISPSDTGRFTLNIAGGLQESTTTTAHDFRTLDRQPFDRTYGPSTESDPMDVQTPGTPRASSDTINK